MSRKNIEISSFSHFFIADKNSAILWLVVRLYVGWGWLSAGWEKFHDPTWYGNQSGVALNGFVQGALQKTGGAHPDVQGWYAAFLQSALLPHLVAWAHFVTLGEILVGLGLIFGCFTGLAAFFGAFMDLNYLLAGTVSVNPIWLVLSIGLVLAWRVAGYIGLDRWVLPFCRRWCRR